MINAREYGKALFLLAEEEQLTEEMLDTLDAVKTIMAQNPGYVKLLDTPAVSTAQKLALIDEAFGEVETIALNFIKILCEKRSVYQFPRCADAFRQLYEETRGIENAQAVTSRPLTEEQLSALKNRLETLTGKTIQLENIIDPKLIGGITLRVGGKQFDHSLRARLDALQSSLGKTIV